MWLNEVFKLNAEKLNKPKSLVMLRLPLYRFNHSELNMNYNVFVT